MKGVTYSKDLRDRALQLVDEGNRKKWVAKTLKIGRATLYRWLGLRKEKGNANPPEEWRNGHSHIITDLEAFRIFVTENADLTLTEMAQKFGRGSISTISRGIAKINFTFKKKLLVTKNEVKKSAKTISR